MKKKHDFIPFEHEELSDEESARRAVEFYKFLDKRRSVREFSERPVELSVIENIIMAASTAPSGAHKQPWTFCVVSKPEIKSQIRKAAEREEYKSYHGRMSDEWLEDLAPFGTDWHKPFLEIAPHLIIVFKRAYELVDGNKRQNYYVNESVGIACGMLITAIHNAGLVTLTHTPSPMNFLAKILDRPENERAYLLIPVGYPAKDAEVPKLDRKPKSEVLKQH